MGSFAAMARHLVADDDGNAAVGPVLAVDSQGCVTWAGDGRMTALLGVRDLIVVHAHGVTLVAPKSRAEDVKKLVESLPGAGLGDFA